MSTVSNASHTELETLFHLTTQAYEQAQTSFLRLELYQRKIQKDAIDASNSGQHDAAQDKELRVQSLLALVKTIQHNTLQVYAKAQAAFEQIASTSLNTVSPPSPPNLTDTEIATLFSSSSTAYLELKNALLTLANAYLDDTLLQDNSKEHWADKARDILQVFLAANDETNHHHPSPFHAEIDICLYESYYKPACHALQTKQWQDAQQNLETLVHINEDYKDAHALLCEVYAQLAEASIQANALEQADTYLALLGKLDPSNKEIATFSQRHPRFLYYLWQANKLPPGLWLLRPQVDERATCLALSPNRQFLAIGFSSGKIGIYTPTGNELLSTLSGRHKGEIRCIAFAPDNETLASGDSIGMIMLWNAHTGDAHGKFPNAVNHPIEKVTFLADALAFQFIDTNRYPHLYIWEEKNYRTTRHKATRIAFEPTKQLSAMGFQDGTLEIGELAGIKNPFPQAHGGKVIDISFSPNKQYLSSLAENNTLKLWRLGNKGKGIRPLFTHPGSTMAFSSNGHMFASADLDGNLILWDTDSQTRRATFSLPDPLPEEHILKMFFSPDQQFWLLISQERILIASLQQIENTDVLPVILTRHYEGGKIKRDSIVLASQPLSLLFCDEHGTVASLRLPLEANEQAHTG